MELDGTHVLITGASRGIGAAMANRFASAGARVSLAARSEAAISSLASQLDGHAFPVDLLDAEATDGLISRVEDAAGPVDVLVNNAGLETSQWFHRIDRDEIRDVTRLNLEVPMLLTRDVIEGMVERNRGHVVMVSSLAGTCGFPGLAVYGATKAGLTNFVAALRMELAETEIGTTVVAPGPVDTQMWDSLEDQDDLDPMLTRLRQLQLIPKKSPEMLAKRTVAAVISGRRHVRVPRRLTTNHMLREAPTRLTEALLTGVPVGVKKGEAGRS